MLICFGLFFCNIRLSCCILMTLFERNLYVQYLIVLYLCQYLLRYLLLILCCLSPIHEYIFNIYLLMILITMYLNLYFLPLIRFLYDLHSKQEMIEGIEYLYLSSTNRWEGMD